MWVIVLVKLICKVSCLLVLARFAVLWEGLSLPDLFLDDLSMLSGKLGNFGLLDS